MRKLSLAYGFAVLVVAVACVLRLLLDPYLGDDLPLVFFYVAATIVAIFGATRKRPAVGPSVLAIVLGFLAADWFFLTPRESLFFISRSHQGEAVVYFFVTLVMALLAEAARGLRGRAREALLEADRRNEAFLAVLGHELRNPLAPIMASAAALRHLGKENPGLAEQGEVIERQTLRMKRLIDDLLDVSRASRGKLQLVREPVDLAVAVAQAVEAADPLVEEKSHRLKVSLPSTGTIFVQGDLARLTQVFNNLLNNAAKYTDPGGEISLVVEQRGKEAMVLVRDTGVGIPRERVREIFDAFTQLSSSAARARGGVGIGLALVRHLVEMHGGRISARSEGPGEGSEFEVHLPLLEGGTTGFDPASRIAGSTQVDLPSRNRR